MLPSPRQTSKNEPDWISSVLGTVPEHASFPVVPPPPLYSELEESSSNTILHKTVPAAAVLANDIPPPFLETEATLKTQDIEDKDHDSGFDQSPEILTRTPTVGLSEGAPVQDWEDPDSGSSLDVMSTIPPPVDFATTRPITPPSQFANPMVAPPVEFVEEPEPEEVKLRKKLNISEALFPWMNEPQAPLNATVPLAVSDGLGKDRESGENVQGNSNKQEYGETKTQAMSGTVAQNDENQINEKPPEPEFVTEQRVVAEVNEAPPMELPRSLSSEESKGSAVALKVDMKDSNELNEVTVVSEKSKEKNQFGSQEGLNATVKPLKPKPKAKPIKLVKETAVEIEPNVGIQQVAPALVNQSSEVERPEPHVEAVKLERQVKPEIPEKQARPVEIVKEPEIKIEEHTPSPFIVPEESAISEPQVEATKLEPPVKPEKPETQAKPVEPEVKIDDQHHAPSSINPAVETLVEAVKPEAPVKPVAVASDQGTEVKDETHVPSPFIPSVKSARPEQQVVPSKPEPLAKPEQPETRVKPVTFVKETEVEAEPKVDIQPSNPSTKVAKVEPQVDTVKPVLQVKPAKPEKLQSHANEEIVIPLVKHKVEENVHTLEEEKPDMKRDIHEVTSEINAPLEDTGVTIINVGEDVVVEAPVTPETKPTSSSNDRLRDLEERLQELDKETAPSSSDHRKPDTNTAKKPHLDKQTVQSKDPFAEDVIVAKTKQVETSSHGHFDELLKLNSEDEPVKDVKSVANKDEKTDSVEEKQTPHLEDSKSRTVADAELRLDLSSLGHSPEPPRPPSSSPPVTTPRSSILPSPRELLSDRSTESGISLTDETRILSDTVEPHGDKESAAVNNTSGAIKPQPAEKPTNVFGKLQRPLSMPSGILREFKSETVPEKRPSVTDSDSRKSSSSDSTGVSSSSLPSSPIECGSTTEPVELPKPPPFSVPPLRRYSDLASDLSFVSSAAKASEKTNESETKAEVPPKPAKLALKRSAASVVERPRSWMGPETNNNKRSTMWSSAAFKPVSFDAQGRKVARPVAFDVKTFAAPSGGATTPFIGNVDAVKTVSNTERKSSPIELEKSSKNAPFLPEKPSGNLTVKPKLPVVSPLVKEEASSTLKPASTDTNSKPLLKKTEPRETKYEIVFSNNSSETNGVSKDLQGKSSFGSHGPSQDLNSSSSIREQIMRDATGGNRVTRPRPQSPIVGGASWADVKKLAALQSAGVKTEDSSQAHTKRQADVPSKPDVPHVTAKPAELVKAVDSKPEKLKSAENTPQTGNTPDVKTDPAITADIKPQQVKTGDSKPQPLKGTDINLQPVKQAENKPQPTKPADIKAHAMKAADATPLPTIVMRPKKGNQDPAKRHSMPAYIIEGADRKAPPRGNTSGGGQVLVCFLLVKIGIKGEGVE